MLINRGGCPVLSHGLGGSLAMRRWLPAEPMPAELVGEVMDALRRARS